MTEKRVHLIFDGPDGLSYDTAQHDMIEEDGSLATCQRIADTFGVPVEQVEEDRRARQASGKRQLKQEEG